MTKRDETSGLVSPDAQSCEHGVMPRTGGCPWCEPGEDEFSCPACEQRSASAPQCECSEAVDGDPPCPVHPRETADNKSVPAEPLVDDILNLLEVDDPCQWDEWPKRLTEDERMQLADMFLRAKHRALPCASPDPFTMKVQPMIDAIKSDMTEGIRGAGIGVHRCVGCGTEGAKWYEPGRGHVCTGNGCVRDVHPELPRTSEAQPKGSK